VTSLLDRELIVVTGKGGVGRTTVTAALGLAAARAGRRTCIVELSGQDQLARKVGFHDARYEPRRVAPDLDLRSLSLPDCLADFGGRKLKLPGVARRVVESRLMTGIVDAIPGLHDLVQLGKLENMLREPLPGEPVYDLAVLDAPATGHGLTLLAAARSMREMTGTGPFHELASIIERLLEDAEATGVALVTLPEALPVNESLDLVRALATEHAPPDAVLVNQVGTRWPASVPPERILGALAGGDPVQRMLHAVAAAELERQERQDAAIADLRARLPAAGDADVPVHLLPVVEGGGFELLADALAEVFA
jgi:anion-transporting  ArsA/GET3 family ATPase